MFRHFKTLKEAKAHIAANPHRDLTYKKHKGKRPKPYQVGTRLSFLHFT